MSQFNAVCLYTIFRAVQPTSRTKASVARSLSCRSIASSDVTSLSQTKSGRSGNLPQIVENNGEPSRARTCDPLIKSQLLYQLSYRPMRLTRVELYGGEEECQAGLFQISDFRFCRRVWIAYQTI